MSVRLIDSNLKKLFVKTGENYESSRGLVGSPLKAVRSIVE